MANSTKPRERFQGRKSGRQQGMGMPAANQQNLALTPGIGTTLIWVGLLARRHSSPPTFPCNAQWHEVESSGLQQRGLRRTVCSHRVTGFPFHPPHDCEARHPKQRKLYSKPSATRFGRGDEHQPQRNTPRRCRAPVPLARESVIWAATQGRRPFLNGPLIGAMPQARWEFFSKERGRFCCPRSTATRCPWQN
jgi:hypothetical protein